MAAQGLDPVVQDPQEARRVESLADHREDQPVGRWQELQTCREPFKEAHLPETDREPPNRAIPERKL